MVDFDIIAVVQQYAVLPVAVVCYLAGAVLKRLEVFADKYIPLALLPVGLIGALWINAWAIAPETVFAGIASAALAVYSFAITTTSRSLYLPISDLLILQES